MQPGVLHDTVFLSNRQATSGRVDQLHDTEVFKHPSTTSDPSSLAREVGVCTAPRSRATGGRLENIPFYLPLEAGWRTLRSTCHGRQAGEHSVLIARGGRLENTPFYLPREAGWRTRRPTGNQRQKKRQYLRV